MFLLNPSLGTTSLSDVFQNTRGLDALKGARARARTHPQDSFINLYSAEIANENKVSFGNPKSHEFMLDSGRGLPSGFFSSG